MSQADYSINNQPAAPLRAELNNTLEAIATNNSGALEPTTTYAHQEWVDTTSGKLKRRNAANDGWIEIEPDIASIYGGLLSIIYPVGSIYTNATSSTNPGTLFGFGTWEAFGAGRVPVGIDASQTEFDTIGETGGAKTHTLTTGEMPAHSHNVSTGDTGPGGGSLVYRATSGAFPQATSSTGSGEAHNNLQPYIVVYMWKRTA